VSELSTKSSIKAVAAAIVTVALVIFGANSLVGADVLLIQSIQEAPANGPEGIPRPVRGMSKKEVEQFYGAPVQKYAPVGQPPISQWEYGGYSVFFESDSVLHSVVHRAPKP
jgi:hypothetical protein